MTSCTQREAEVVGTFLVPVSSGIDPRWKENGELLAAMLRAGGVAESEIAQQIADANSHFAELEKAQTIRAAALQTSVKCEPKGKQRIARRMMTDGHAALLADVMQGKVTKAQLLELIRSNWANDVPLHLYDVRNLLNFMQTELAKLRAKNLARELVHVSAETWKKFSDALTLGGHCPPPLLRLQTYFASANLFTVA